MIESKRKLGSFLCSFCLPLVVLLSVIFLFWSSYFVADYTEMIMGCNFYTVSSKKSKICENVCRPNGTETLPRGIVSPTTDLEMRQLRGLPDKKRSIALYDNPLNFIVLFLYDGLSVVNLAIFWKFRSDLDTFLLKKNIVGIKQMQNVNEIVKKFPMTEFVIMLFHYDGNVDGWRDFEWSSNAIHVSAIHQTKWWFAKRFLHPDVVAHYGYIFLWDEDLGVENFHVGRYLSIVKKEGLQISQPAIDGNKSEVHYQLTTREIKSEVHRRSINLHGPGRRCYGDSMEPPCTGFVEMMAPVFSMASWRCVWYMIQNDLVYGWGLDFQLGYCAKGNRTSNVGIVDSEYIIHLGLPTLGGSPNSKDGSETEKRTSPNNKVPDRGKSVTSSLEQSDDRSAVRRESYVELERFKSRWRKAVRDDECWVDPFQQPSAKRNGS